MICLMFKMLHKIYSISLICTVKFLTLGLNWDQSLLHLIHTGSLWWILAPKFQQPLDLLDSSPIDNGILKWNHFVICLLSSFDATNFIYMIEDKSKKEKPTAKWSDASGVKIEFHPRSQILLSYWHVFDWWIS